MKDFHFIFQVILLIYAAPFFIIGYVADNLAWLFDKIAAGCQAMGEWLLE